jgi:hypothetical protein
MLNSPEGTQALSTIKQDANGHSRPLTATLVEELLQSIDTSIEEAKREPLKDRIRTVLIENLPVFIYFDDYGVLDSAIYLPRFLEDIKRTPDESRTRTIAAMFKHVNVSPEKITELGREKAAAAKHAGQVPSSEVIEGDRRNKEERAIVLNSASLDISKRFSSWWRQRRHKIRYQADGDYFRIWVSDDRRPDVEIELEERSKGFQWFFSFYLIFLVESDEGHKDAVLLLDEPGLHLHPTAQQELIEFFEVLSDKNQLLYSTHSPFLIDGDRLSRVRPVTEDESGHSTIAVGYWPSDRETIFPLWAAAGYAMMMNLFEHKKNLLVEGMTDFYYLGALSDLCRANGRAALSADTYVTPCGGAKSVSPLASLFLARDIRPAVLLDSDEEGKVRRQALLKNLYQGHDDFVILLGDVVGISKGEIEDLIGESVLLPAVSKFIGSALTLGAPAAGVTNLVDRIVAAAKKAGIDLPDGWKATVALEVVSDWVEGRSTVPDDLLARAATGFERVNSVLK